MRTTVTLDEDVAQQIRQRMRERDASFKAVLNDLIRRGLRSTDHVERYTTPTFRMGVRPDIDLDKALALAGALDDEETRAKLERAK
jgi:ribosomal protein L10